jgi:hypothetical protein
MRSLYTFREEVGKVGIKYFGMGCAMMRTIREAALGKIKHRTS